MDTKELIDRMVARFESKVDGLLRMHPLRFDDGIRRALPSTGGVYRVSLLGADLTKSLYVGQSKNLRSRVGSDHMGGNGDWSVLLKKLVGTQRASDAPGAVRFLREHCQLQFIEEPSQRDRKRLEHYVIALLHPDLNDLLGDGSSGE